MTLTIPPLGPHNSVPDTASAVVPPRRIAVFGSVSAERPARSVEPPPSSARAVLERVFAEISAQAPRIAAPILERAVGAGTITAAERDELLHELGDPDATHESVGAVPWGVAAREVLHETFVAIRRASPGIAEPILNEAVAAECLTPAQQRRILERLRSSPASALRARARGGSEI